MSKSLISYLLLVSLLTSCGGSFSYKRGARPEALNTAKTDCQSAGLKTKEAVEACLEQKGWSVYQFDDMDLFAEASESTKANGGRKVDTAFVDVDDGTEKKVAAIPEKPTEKEPTKIDSSEHTQNKTAQPSPVKQHPKDPYTKYKVSSWWKWGSNQQMLENDLNSCKESLGEKHYPDFAKQMVTRGFVICMHKNGWKALKAK